MLEDFTLGDDVLEGMVRRLFASSEDTEDVVASACGREERTLLRLCYRDVGGLSQRLSLSEVAVEVLRIEAPENSYSGGVSTHHEGFVSGLACRDR